MKKAIMNADVCWGLVKTMSDRCTSMSNKTRLLTYQELRNEKIKLARSTLWNLEKEGKFPLRRVHGGRVYWVESEIDEWLGNLPTKQEQVA
jgi:predicted DNA-binding transcriptional regulator AlpA